MKHTRACLSHNLCEHAAGRYRRSYLNNAPPPQPAAHLPTICAFAWFAVFYPYRRLAATMPRTLPTCYDVTHLPGRTPPRAVPDARSSPAAATSRHTVATRGALPDGWFDAGLARHEQGFCRHGGRRCWATHRDEQQPPGMVGANNASLLRSRRFRACLPRALGGAYYWAT